MKINRNNYEAWFLDYAEGTLSPEQVADLLLFLEENPDLKNELDAFEIISLEEEKPVFEAKSLLKKNSAFNNEEFENQCIAYSEGLLSEHEKSELEQTIGSDKEKARTFRLYQLVKTGHNDEINNERALLYQNKSLFSTDARDRDVLLVAYTEGWLNADEKRKVDALAAADPVLKKELDLYRNTLLSAQHTVVFPDKSALKKGEAKLIYFNWKKAMSYVAAAAILLMMFTVLNTLSEKTETFADSEKHKKENKITAPEKQPVEEISTEHNNIADHSAEKKENEKEENNLVREIEKKIVPESFVVEQKEKVLANQLTPADSSVKNPEIKQVNNTNNSLANQHAVKNNSDSLTANEENKDQFAYAGDQKERDYMSPGEFLRRRANKKVFGKEEVTQDEINESLSRQFTKATGKTVSFAAAQEEEYKEVQFSVGNFSFSRKTRK